MNTPNQFVLGGTPTRAGRFSFRLKATDLFGNSAERDYSVDIIGIANDTDLTEATSFVAYSETLLLDGPAEALYWDVIDGEIPNLFTLDRSTGVLSGSTDSATGDYEFTIRVTTTLGVQCSKLFRLHVNNPCPIWNDMGLGTLTASLPTIGASGFGGILTDLSNFLNPYPGYVPCEFNPLTVIGPPIPMWSWQQYNGNVCPCFFDTDKYVVSSWNSGYPTRQSPCGCDHQNPVSGCECPGLQCEQRITSGFDWSCYNSYQGGLGGFSPTNMTRVIWLPIVKGRPCRCRLTTRQMAVPQFGTYAIVTPGQITSVQVYNALKTSVIQILIDPGWYVGVPPQWTQSSNFLVDGISWIDFIVNNDVVGHLGDPRFLKITFSLKSPGFSNPTPPHSAIPGWYQLIGRFTNLGVI